MNRLREIRLAKGLTQYQLGKLAGTYQTRIWQWENGYYIPKRSEKERLAIALGINVKDIFPEE